MRPPTEAGAPYRVVHGPRPFHPPLAYLRAFVIVLVVAHHAAQGYNAILPAEPASSLAEHLGSLRAVSPVIDPRRSELLSLFSAFNDAFFMSLLFLLSGAFVWRSLQAKGGPTFLRDRLLRLGVPLVAMILLRPLTYYPTYLEAGGQGGVAGFWEQWTAIGWRGGPLWFLQVLLLFDVLVVAFAPLLRGAPAALRSAGAGLVGRPVAFLAVFAILSLLAYVPPTLAWGSFAWVQVGPAQLQLNRLPLYGLYFLAGLSLGACGIERTFLVPGSPLARRWALWTIASLVVFTAYVATAIGGAGTAAGGSLYALSSAVTSWALLAIFLRFARRRVGVFDGAFRSSYGIYVLHYGVVSWLLFAFLAAALPPLAKWASVSALALCICWAATAALRRIPGVARIL